jgi:Glycosyltransferase
MKPKVLYILNTSSYSGAENVVITIINNLKDNYDVAYVSFDGKIREKLAQERILFLPIKKMSIKELRRVIHSFQPSIIHAHDFTASIMAGLATWKIPIISHLHHNPPWIKTYCPKAILYYLFSIRFKQIVAVSDSIMNEYVFGDLLKSKTNMLSNPIDTREICNRSMEDSELVSSYDVVFLGRLAEPKDPIRFIERMKGIINLYPNVKIAMIGDGPLRDECDMKIKELNLSKNISLIGYLNNPYPILLKAKVLCMTSKWEGFGLVVIEAMTLGKPVVATTVGGLTGLIDNTCGFLTEKDHLYEEEVTRLLMDTSYYIRKSEGAKRKAAALNNIKEYITALCKLYSKLL